MTALTALTASWPYVAALIPTCGVAFLFYVVIKNMIEGDRKERLAHSQWEAEQQVAEQQKAEQQKAEQQKAEEQKARARARSGDS